MLITIIAVVVLIVSIILAIIGNRLYDSYSRIDFLGFPLTVASIVVGAIAFIVTGFCVITSIGNNNDLSCRNMIIAYEEKVEELQSTYNTLITYEDNEITRVSITEYNAEVKEFKVDILTNQEMLKSQWTNWLICKEYKKFDAEIVSYIK